MARTKEEWQAYISEISKYVEEQYSKRNERIANVTSRRLRLEPAKIPVQFKQTAAEMRSPIVSDFIRRAKMIIGGSLPMPKRQPIKEGPAAQGNSTDIEEWFTAAYQQMNSARGNTWGMITDSIVADGMAVWKLATKLNSWGNVNRNDDEGDDEYNDRVEEEHKSNFPFYWEHVASSTFYPIAYDEEGLSEVIEITKRQSLPVANKYGLGIKDGKLARLGEPAVSPMNIETAPKTCDVKEYWSRTHCVYMIDDTIIKISRHNYKRPPYFCALADVTGIKDVSYQGISLADPLLSIQDLLDAFITIQMNWAFLNGFPTPKLVPVDPDAFIDTKNPPVVEWKVGEMMVPPNGFTIDFLNVPPVGSDLTQLRDYLKGMADQVSLAPVLYGYAAGADTANATTLTLISVAKSVLSEATNNIVRQFNEMGEFMLWLIDKVIQKDVPISYDDGEKKAWKKIGPSDIKGYYRMEHDLQPIIPSERQWKAIMLADAHQRGAVDMNTYREDGLGYTAPEKLDKKVKIEEFRNMPEYRSTLWAEIARRIQAVNPMAQQQGTPANMPIGMAGPGISPLAGIQQPMTPGGPMAAPPQGTSQPAPQGGVPIG